MGDDLQGQRTFAVDPVFRAYLDEPGRQFSKVIRREMLGLGDVVVVGDARKLVATCRWPDRPIGIGDAVNRVGWFVNQFSETIDESGVIDITTVGAKSGQDRRIEINFLQLGGRYYITGRPGRKRDWQANMAANPNFTVHLKGENKVDIPATARLITEPDERGTVLYQILTDGWGNEKSKADHILQRWVDGAPLVEFTVD